MLEVTNAQRCFVLYYKQCGKSNGHNTAQHNTTQHKNTTQHNNTTQQHNTTVFCIVVRQCGKSDGQSGSHYMITRHQPHICFPFMITLWYLPKIITLEWDCVLQNYLWYQWKRWQNLQTLWIRILATKCVKFLELISSDDKSAIGNRWVCLVEAAWLWNSPFVGYEIEKWLRAVKVVWRPALIIIINDNQW